MKKYVRKRNLVTEPMRASSTGSVNSNVKSKLKKHKSVSSQAVGSNSAASANLTSLATTAFLETNEIISEETTLADEFPQFQQSTDTGVSYLLESPLPSRSAELLNPWDNDGHTSPRESNTLSNEDLIKEFKHSHESFQTNLEQKQPKQQPVTPQSILKSKKVLLIIKPLKKTVKTDLFQDSLNFYSENSDNPNLDELPLESEDVSNSLDSFFEDDFLLRETEEVEVIYQNSGEQKKAEDFFQAVFIENKLS